MDVLRRAVSHGFDHLICVRGSSLWRLEAIRKARGAETRKLIYAKTGEVIWGPQRTAIGTVSASPLLADGKLYVTNENGVTTVLDKGGTVIATDEVDRGYTLSSLAVMGSRLLLRTATHLYCLGK